MKKTLNVVLAVILAVAMFASVAYVASPERTSEYQISLVSVKAVNVQDATQGVRSYAELVDTTRAYQVNDVIYLAITSEVKNLEKYPTLKSIANKDIKVVVGSPSIDLSYAKLGTPTLLANIWSGYTAVDVATVGWYAPAQVMLEYDKNANEVSWKFRGYTQYGMGTSSAVASSDLARLQDSQLGNNYFAQNLVVFNPYFNTSTKKIEIPAIKLKKSTSKWVLGETTYTLDYEAPDAIAYTMVLTGVTKDNAGASKGTFYAKIEISGAEKFEDYDSYYVGDDGYAYNTEAAVKAAVGVKWLNYIKVEIKKLEIAGAYNVYKYWIPSSALQIEIPAIYAGDHDDYDDDTEDSIVGGKILAYANPNKYDNATSKSGKLDTTDIAGALRTIKAYRNWTEANDANNLGKTYEFPATSVVFTNYKAVYAPGFYGGAYSSGTESTQTFTYSTDALASQTASETFSSVKEYVDYFTLTLSDTEAAAFNKYKVRVYELDDSNIMAAAATPVATGDFWAAPLGVAKVVDLDFTAERIPNTNEIRVTAMGSNAKNIIAADPSAPRTNQWLVFYEGTQNGAYWTSAFIDARYAFVGDSKTATLAPELTAADYGTAAADLYYPVFAEVMANLPTPTTEQVLLFGPLTTDAGKTDITLTGLEQVSKFDIYPAYWRNNAATATTSQYGINIQDARSTAPVTPSGTEASWYYAFNEAGIKTIGGKQYIWVGDLQRYDATTSAWVDATVADLMSGTNSWVSGKLSGATYTAGATAVFTYNDKTDATVGSWDSSKAAPSANWETGTNSVVVGHNGITMYTICSNSNDKPYVTLATETNEFTNADDGYGIAMFDNINYSLVKKDRLAVARIYRSNDTNLAYSRHAGHVDDGTTIISAMKYFGLDTSFGTTYKVVDETFESKGAAAVFSENVEGEFQYGTITIIPDNVEEGTVEEDVEPEEEEDPVIEEPEEEDPVIEEPDVTPPVVKTGDASANIAIALAAAAIVAAAGLAFVMKKVR